MRDSQSPRKRPPGGTPSGASILIAVDDPDLATTCLRFLRQLGHVPRVELSADAAFALVATGWPEVVVLDLGLPGGLPGLERLNRGDDDRRPAVLCVGRASEAMRRQALAAGAIAYLAKPFSLGELQRAVERGVGMRGQRAAEGGP